VIRLYKHKQSACEGDASCNCDSCATERVDSRKEEKKKEMERESSIRARKIL